MTAHELLGFMSPGLAQEILEFSYANDKPLYRSILNAVAEARKLRPVFYERKPRVERHVDMLAMLSRPRLEPMAGLLVRSWLLKTKTPMLRDFLDALGIAHEDGVVEDLPKAVEDAKLNAAIDALLAKHSQESVVVYLNAFQTMNEATWPNLATALSSDPRLQLK